MRPQRKELRFSLSHATQPVNSLTLMVTKSLELATHPVHKTAFQAPQDGCQGRWIISAIIVHPTTYERIDELRDLLQAQNS